MSTRKLPPAEDVIRLVREEGWTMAEVARHYGATRPAVSYCFRQAGLGSQRTYADYRQFIPWRVRVAHNMDRFIVLIRLWAREQMGLELQPHERARLDQGVAMLRSMNKVIAYDPDDGFYLVQRAPKDGPGIVRWP